MLTAICSCLLLLVLLLGPILVLKVKDAWADITRDLP